MELLRRNISRGTNKKRNSSEIQTERTVGIVTEGTYAFKQNEKTGTVPNSVGHVSDTSVDTIETDIKKVEVSVS